jgi:hypothetical protein
MSDEEQTNDELGKDLEVSVRVQSRSYSDNDLEGKRKNFVTIDRPLAEIRTKSP